MPRKIRFHNFQLSFSGTGSPARDAPRRRGVRVGGCTSTPCGIGCPPDTHHLAPAGRLRRRVSAGSSPSLIAPPGMSLLFSWQVHAQSRHVPAGRLADRPPAFSAYPGSRGSSQTGRGTRQSKSVRHYHPPRPLPIAPSSFSPLSGSPLAPELCGMIRSRGGDPPRPPGTQERIVRPDDARCDRAGVASIRTPGGDDETGRRSTDDRAETLPCWGSSCCPRRAAPWPRRDRVAGPSRALDRAGRPRPGRGADGPGGERRPGHPHRCSAACRPDRAVAFASVRGWGRRVAVS